MADVDIDPFGEHESRPEVPTDENIPGRGGVPTWEPEQETSFIEGKSNKRKFTKRQKVNELYLSLFERLEDIPKAFHVDKFEVRDGHLYYVGNDQPLTFKETGELTSI